MSLRRKAFFILVSFIVAAALCISGVTSLVIYRSFRQLEIENTQRNNTPGSISGDDGEDVALPPIKEQIIKAPLEIIANAILSQREVTIAQPILCFSCN